MPRVYLTDLTVRKLPASATHVTYWDTALPSFGIRVGLKSRTFICMRGRARERISLGTYPAVSVKLARIAALEVLNGERPPSPRPTPPSEHLELYLRSLNAGPRWVAEQERLLKKHFLSHVKAIESVTKADILSMCDRLRHVPSEQVHAFRAMRAFFNWCRARDLIEKSPLDGLPLPNTPRSRSRVLTDDELVRVWRACPENAYGYIVRLLILTGQRRGQIACIHRARLSRLTVTWSPEFMKGNEEHTIPLTPLARRYEEKLSPLLTERPFISWGKPKIALDQAGQVHDWTLHDLRRTFSTKMAELLVPPHVTERILSHATGSLSTVAKIYNRYKYLPEMQQAMHAYEDHLLALLKDIEPTVAALP